MRSKGRNQRGEPIGFRKVKMTTQCMFWKAIQRLNFKIQHLGCNSHAIAGVLDNRFGLLDNFLGV